MDCLEGMRQMPDKSVDLIVTDPPYNLFKIGGDKPFGKTKIGGDKPFGKTKIGGDNICHAKEYPAIDWDFKLTDEYIKEIFRISKNQIIFGFEHLSDRLPQSRGVYCWDKKRGENTTFSDFELIWTSFNKKATFIRFKWNGMLRDSWEVEKNIRVHPTQKPLEIIKILIKEHSKEGDLICDPFMGSGTTALACHQLGRTYIGFEISKEYCEIAKKRLCQQVLKSPPAKKPEMIYENRLDQET